MNLREWALVAFTILSQMSVGAFVVLGVVHFLALRKSNMAEADKLSDRALLAIGPTLVFGFIASMFHLGNPLNAPRAISNFGSSWLSREIAFGVLFLVLGAAFAFMQWRKVGSPSLRTGLAALAAVVGLAQVYSMAQVYLLPTVPAWNTVATPVAFFATSFLLGSLAMGTAFVVNYTVLQGSNSAGEMQLGLLRDALRWIALGALVLLGVEFIVVPMQVATLASGSSAAVASAGVLVNQNGLLFVVRLVLVFLGAGVISLYIYKNAVTGGKVQVLGNLAYLAFALVLVAEIVGRYLFYASFVKIGI